MSYETVFYALGTENTITVEKNDKTGAVERAVERVLEIDEKMSAFKETSEITKISRNAGKSPVVVSEDVYYVLEKALEISRVSNGAFDFTIKPLTRLWGFGSGRDCVPDISEIICSKAQVGYQHLTLDANAKTAFLNKSGFSIDLGAIAKGYAADETKRILMEEGIDSALINFGGNIIAMGNSPGGSPWKIGIQNPLLDRGSKALTLEVSGKSVVTSAVSERFFIEDGVRYHHIISPTTGYPALSGLLSVSVIDDSSLLADALSTAVFVLGMEKGLELIRKYRSEAVFITEAGEIFSTYKLN